MSSSSSTNISAFSTPLSPSTNSDIKTQKFVYCTAYIGKKERTAELVYSANKAGFRGFDTGAQPMLYDENGVGERVRKSIEEGLVKREELFMNNILTLEACCVLSFYVPTKIRSLGLSNTALDDLKQLTASARVHQPPHPIPSIRQNVFHETEGYGVYHREFCPKNGIISQHLRMLDMNLDLLHNGAIVDVLALALEGKVQTGEEKAIALYGLVIDIGGISIFYGTTSAGANESLFGRTRGVERAG
ncbi:uncharacterized protein RCO7_01718 [Rhynchosporium graminicola]|uniref:Uncharacterized protein n=1 Tax=Rhynchosporium graminicola TaxID=2792576 RepID=A0A1E1KPP1_9HELO|nr:uncharacterized protein RCO7_01718 [Rhynchosporium commune]